MIKIILIVCVLGIGLTLYRGPGSSTQRALRRLIALGVAISGVFFVLFPDGLTQIANAIGVGRGTDLLLYGLVVTFGFVAIGLFQRMLALEQRLEALTRAQALSTVHLGPEVRRDD